MSLSFRSLADVALALQTDIGDPDRFQRLVQRLHQLLKCDATALLHYDHGIFRPLAMAGLPPDVCGRHFRIDEHPRLEAIARAGDIVRFPADSALPDPYDGLIPGHEHMHVHACIGLPLLRDQMLIGALTLDGLSADQFSDFSDEALRLISALVAVALDNALLVRQLEEQPVQLPMPRSPGQSTAHDMIGQSRAMQQLRQEIAVVAGTDLSVLILGETGVGKELVAQAVHAGSPRAAQDMVYLNCAALPESVAESELFGHVKGAFTGAISNRAGKFEMANHGTLFLDEIGELSLSLQAKLLRVLQYGDVQRIGDDRSVKVDVRIIAATNVDLKEAVLQGRFRADLYHRLSVFPVHVASLREREGDIALLAGFFCERCRARLSLRQLSLSPAALQRLERYPWPGNVRELEHVIYRAAVIAGAVCRQGEAVLKPEHLALEWTEETRSDDTPTLSGQIAAVHIDVPQASLRDATEAFQRRWISDALTACHGNWTAAARQLGVNAPNLHRLAKRLQLK
ncbi:nitric oxide reductase transcriptional regulator NorR [Zymobacter palmae]|uniref:Anaerobic nitric oxide reductase transcription regulator n=1 Tax=Zymobacter palmae TaxID=33074 RepID=A0A348HI31_9GAMM|nr:nitric oxide reductase transcriptional regulator NorR [Zymobacter palmae]BBG31283.1 anaerobic nitric oxide reductase transcription regulator [Zymobacter palmae]